MEANTQSPTRWWQEPQILCLLLIVSLAHFYWLDGLTIRGEEPRRIAIGQEMLRTGDWIVPRIQGEPVFFRPPMQNWLIGLSIAARGSADHLAVRLPGIMAILLTCLWLYGYGRRFLTPLGAFSAAAAFATMAQVLELGRLAETESVFTFFIAAALLTWHAGWSKGWSARRVWMVAYAIAGLGALTKGLQAPIYLFTATAVYLFWTGAWRRFFTLAHGLGLVTCGAVFAVWFVPYVAYMGWENGVRTVVGETTMRLDYSNKAELVEHLWSYPLWVLSCMLPWSFYLTAYLRTDVRAVLGRAMPMVRFAASAILVSFPTCWAVPAANARYWMPLYPCAALLVGLVVERSALATEGTLLRRHWTGINTGLGLLLIILALVMAICRPAGLAFRLVDAQPFGDLVLFTLVTAAVGGLHLFYRRATHGLTVFAFAIFLALSGSIVFPNFLRSWCLDVETPVAQFKQKIPADASFFSFGQADHRFAFYFGQRIQRISWSEKETVPTSAYFCYAVDRPDKAPPSPLPFNWEKVDVLWMDRFPDQFESFVVVGRRMSP